MEVSDATVIGPVTRPIGRLEATAAVAADDQAGEQRGAVAGAPLGARTRSVLMQGFLIRQVAIPGDVGRQAIVLQDLPLFHRDPVAGDGAFPGRRPDALVRPAAIGVGPGIDRMSQDLEDGQQDRSSPLQVAAIGPVVRAKAELDVVADQVMEDPPGGADLVVLVEDQADDLADLLVGVHLDPLGGELDVAGRHAVKEFAALGLVQPSSFQSIPHSNKLEFADGSLQAEQEPVVGVLRVVDAVLVREDRPEDGTHLQEIVPILVVAGDPAHLDPEDQADMLHGNLGQEALESASLVGRPATLSLVVVDDQDAIPGPSQGDRMVGEGVLPLPRFAMVEHLLGVGLAHVNDGDAIEVKVEDLRRSQDARAAGKRRRRRQPRPSACLRQGRS